MMHSTKALALFSVLALVGACAGGDSGDGAGGADPGTVGAGGGADAEMAEGAEDASAAVNGCTRASARNMKGHANVTIHFPSPSTSLRYSPACVRVSKGTRITWAGDFGVHPLQAGRVNPRTLVATVSHTSPIHETSSGSRASFRFSKKGTFGYYCERHFRLGMKGTVYVE